MRFDSYSFPVWIGLFFGMLIFSPPLSAQPESLSARIDSIAHAALRNGPVAGLSIAVVKEGKMLHAQGYGVTDVESRRPATTETIYNFASVAKIIAAAAVLTLVDSGRLDLDEDLATLLPEFPNPGQGRAITLRQLLNHTSGLHDYAEAAIERWSQTGSPTTSAFVLETVRDRPLDFEPGTHWIYTNTGFVLAGLILERVTGQAWGEYVVEAVARPLGLNSVVLCDDQPEARTKGYNATEDGFIPSSEDAEKGIRGDGGVCGTVLDAARLPGALLESGLLTDESLNEMLRPTLLSSGLRVDYGLGVALGSLDGHPLWGHLGGGPAFVSTLVHYPEDDITIAVLLNTRFADVDALVIEGQVAQAVFDIKLNWAGEPITEEALLPYLGAYEGGQGSRRYRMSVEQGNLARISPSGRKTTLRYVGDHMFGWTSGSFPLDRFVFQVENDRAEAFSAYYYGLFLGFNRRIEP